ncbi:MAG: DNA-binding protein [Alphaproteobacteria bacterium]|nr:DNA-binding protein [Alphaproteobacteria bacterium]
MQSALVHESAGQRTFVIVLSTDDEVMAELRRFVEREGVTAAQFTAIGALSAARLAYFDWEKKAYLSLPVGEQVELASLVGDVAVGPDGRASVHAHAVLGRRDGGALAGHLEAGHVRPTLECVLTESPAHLQKRFDPGSGLALIRLSS